MASSKSPSQEAQGTQNELPVLIIGAGLAGLTVALHMAESQPVILMAKRGLSEAATAWAQGGIVGVVFFSSVASLLISMLSNISLSCSSAVLNSAAIFLVFELIIVIQSKFNIKKLQRRLTF